MIANNIKCKPFLRWAGGKSWLIKHLPEILSGKKFNNYHEPFLGGAAIFFHINPENESFLNDVNCELIETYKCLKTDVEGIINELKKYKNTKEFYYKIRSTKFRSAEKNAARFIYLNQTSFNGIYRVNLKGEYNVPFGFRDKNFLNEINLRDTSKRLEKASFSNLDFTETLSSISKNDLVFLDPPYTITHNNNGFFKYNQKLFSEKDQYRLAEYIEEIKRKGAYYILTNAAHDKVKDIFDNGDDVRELQRASIVGGKMAKRGNYGEIVITNI